MENKVIRARETAPLFITHPIKNPYGFGHGVGKGLV